MAASRTISVTWDGVEKLHENVAGFDERIKMDITAIFEHAKPQAETSMKQNAPWTDRTTNARNGLHAVVESDYDTFWELICAHSVFYGVYLETRFSGKYAIIMPTVIQFGNQIMEQLNRIVDARVAQQ